MSSLPPPGPPDFPWRGCAANFEMPLNDEDEEAAQNLVDTIHRVNCVDGNPRLPAIIYRAGYQYDCDIIRPVFRWDSRPYQEIFQNGFQTNPVAGNSTAYNLFDFVENAGAPLGSHRPRRFAFVSTTISRDWRPQPSISDLPAGGQMQAYRYEIYAPGGIWVHLTLGGLYQYESQAEVCFVGGIAPHYIRSAQLYTFTRSTYDPATQRPPYSRSRRVNNRLTINGNFNPLLDAAENVRLQGPVYCYQDENRVLRFLSFDTYTPEPRREREKRQVSSDKWDAAIEWYTSGVAEVPSYIDAAFRAYSTNEAYIFMKNEYVLLNYAPGTTNDWIVNGPLLICDGFRSLIDTPFGEHGIDCAFDTDYTKAFIFSANLCAYIDYAPGTTDDKILLGPMTITAMFPFFKDTVFEDGIDAAFRATSSNEAYLFRGGQYALINYDSKSLIHQKNISDGFPSLLGTVFESGIDAAFASHRADEAYVFKGTLYALINFSRGTTDHYIIGGRIKRILDNWPSLHKVLPHKNYGLDVHGNHVHTHELEQEQHDEL